MSALNYLGGVMRSLLNQDFILTGLLLVILGGIMLYLSQMSSVPHLDQFGFGMAITGAIIIIVPALFFWRV